MENREIEKKIASAYEDIAPDHFAEIINDCHETKGKVITMENRRKKRSWVKYIAGAAAACALMVGGIFGVNVYNAGNAVASTIMLDVNPSIEIELNKNEKVLAVNALNEDAKEVVGTMDFSGNSLEVTVNALIGSLLRNGYISDAANSILVTVHNSDAASGKQMEERLMAEINNILDSNNIDGALLGTTVAQETEVSKLAKQYNITVGKANLIKQIVDQNPVHKFEELVPLSINELNLIAGSSKYTLKDIDAMGTASDTAYIGEAKAKAAAFKDAGVTESALKYVHCEMDWERGVMVYEVEFTDGVNEYDYDINAQTGVIVKSEIEVYDSRDAIDDTDDRYDDDRYDDDRYDDDADDVYDDDDRYDDNDDADDRYDDDADDLYDDDDDADDLDDRDDLDDDCDDILEGRSDDVPFDFRGLPAYIAKAMTEIRVRADGGVGNIVYKK